MGGPGLAADEVAEFAATIDHPQLRDLFREWVGLRGERPMPSRIDIDPTRVPRLLPNLIINEVTGDPPRFRIRLEGEAITAARGFSGRGRFIDEEGMLVLRDDAIAVYRRIVADWRPAYTKGSFGRLEARWGQLYRLALPLSDDGRRVDHLLVGFYHEI